MVREKCGGEGGGGWGLGGMFLFQVREKTRTFMIS